jgi:hypothetical protein
MKVLLFSAVAVCALTIQLAAQIGLPVPRLSGIINLPEVKRVVLEDVGDPLKGARSWTLAEGEREGEIEVLRIQPEDGAVRLNLHGKHVSVIVTNSAIAMKGAAAAVALDNANLDAVLGLFGELSRRTLLRHPLVLGRVITVQAAATNQTDAAQALQKALGK